MKYNAKYDRWVSKDGLVYRYDKKKDKLVLANQHYSNNGYLVHTRKKDNKSINVLIHRLVWETFNGEIHPGYEIDHINTIKCDNSLDNLRAVTHNDNMNNPLTRKQISESMTGKPKSEFGNKFKEHYGITLSDNRTLYMKEFEWYNRHNKVCRWEVEDK